MRRLALSAGETSSSPRPLLDLSPVPGWRPADYPARLWEEATRAPHSRRLSLHAEPLGDLRETHGFALSIID